MFLKIADEEFTVPTYIVSQANRLTDSPVWYSGKALVALPLFQFKWTAKFDCPRHDTVRKWAHEKTERKGDRRTQWVWFSITVVYRQLFAVRGLYSYPNILQCYLRSAYAFSESGNTKKVAKSVFCSGWGGGKGGDKLSFFGADIKWHTDSSESTRWIMYLAFSNLW